ncbi:hypothetical protein P4O66_017917, partial [Electrophorus voltai]
AFEPTPKIDGQQNSEITLLENVTHHFSCQSEGWNSQAPPLLTWYLNGERQSEVTGSQGVRQLVMKSPEDSRTVRFTSERNSTFTLRPRKWDRELVCAATNPGGRESYNATVILNVQFQPEFLRVNAHYSETSDPGLSLVLFALVRSNPPATITWVDQSGQLVANTSDFLILDSRSYPWLANHSLQVTLSSLSGNVSVSASNNLGSTQTNLTLTEFLQSRVEVPMLGIVTGGVAGFVTLLILTLMVLCLLYKDKSKVIGTKALLLILMAQHVKGRFYKKHFSLGALSANILCNMLKLCGESHILQLRLCPVFRARAWLYNCFLVQVRGQDTRLHGSNEWRPNTKQNTLARKTTEDEEDEEDLSLAYAARGFARYPMVGYIYKVNSTSSDEIWL